MEYVVNYEALAAILHEYLAPLTGNAQPWNETSPAMQRDWKNAVRLALVQADARGLLRLFPDDGDQSLIG